jgi:hypothetical protein
MTGWDTGRPIFHRLPVEGYQNNEVADWLTQWVDIKLMEKKAQLEGLPDKLTVAGCPVEWLDYLAFLVGLSGDYWDTKWTPAVKRSYLTNFKYLWDNRGTFASLQRAFEIHEYPFKIWKRGSIRLPFRIPKPFGREDLRFFVRLPVSYTRSGTDFKTVEKLTRNFTSVVARGRVVYNRFYLGRSVLGEPFFIGD